MKKTRLLQWILRRTYIILLYAQRSGCIIMYPSSRGIYDFFGHWDRGDRSTRERVGQKVGTSGTVTGFAERGAECSWNTSRLIFFPKWSLFFKTCYCCTIHTDLCRFTFGTGAIPDIFKLEFIFIKLAMVVPFKFALLLHMNGFNMDFDITRALKFYLTR